MKVSQGLEGITAFYSSVSSIEEQKLTYRGYSIDELVYQTTFEEIIFLLWYGKLPTSLEIEHFIQELNKAATLSPAFLAHLSSYPVTTHPMVALRTAISALFMFEHKPKSLYEQGISIIAKMPSIISTFFRLKKGLLPCAPMPFRSLSEHFLYAMFGETPDKISVRAFDQALIIHADHEINASTFSARVTVSTLADLVSGVTSALGTLGGALHGGANEQVKQMIESIGSLENIESYIDTQLQQKEKIMGFGHRVYKNGDPRAAHLKNISRELSSLKNTYLYFEMAEKIEEYVWFKKQLRPNVDFYSSALYTSLSIPSEFYTPIFALSRMSGWIAHILEQYQNNRILRPRARYNGPTDQHVFPILSR